MRKIKKGVFIILLYFILGMVFVGLIWPLLDALVGLAVMKLEDKKAKISVSIQKSNVEIEKCTLELEPPQQAIGFDLSSTEDSDYYDE